LQSYPWRPQEWKKKSPDRRTSQGLELANSVKSALIDDEKMLTLEEPAGKV